MSQMIAIPIHLLLKSQTAWTVVMWRKRQMLQIISSNTHPYSTSPDCVDAVITEDVIAGHQPNTSVPQVSDDHYHYGSIIWHQPVSNIDLEVQSFVPSDFYWWMM